MKVKKSIYKNLNAYVKNITNISKLHFQVLQV